MELTYLIESIVEYLFLSSALLFLMGILSFITLRVLKIKGRPKLWICSLLIILPLAYPIKLLVPDYITIDVPLKIFQSFEFQPLNKLKGDNQDTESVSFLTSIKSSTDNTVEMVKASQENGAGSTPLGSHLGQAVSNSSIDWKLITGLIWASFFLYFLFRLITVKYNMKRFLRLGNQIKTLSIIKLLRQCAAETGIHRTPRLLMMDGIRAPMVMGFFKPVIILPKRLLKSEFREGLRFALLHELKHTRQRHNWWLLIESIIGAAYFFHPVFHWAKKEIHKELEHICDRHVVNITSKSSSYADFLLHEIWQQSCKRDPVLALPFITDGTKITNRVRSILENVRPTLFVQIRGKAALGFIFIFFLSILLCSIAPTPEDSEKLTKKPFSSVMERPYNPPIQNTFTELEKEPAEDFKDEEISIEKKIIALDVIEKPSADNKKDVSHTLVNIAEPEIIIKEDEVMFQAELADNQASSNELPSKAIVNTMIQTEIKSDIHTKSSSVYPVDEAIINTASKESIEREIMEPPENAASFETNVPKTAKASYLGDPVNELSFHRIDNIKIINDQTILFIMRGGGLYLTRLSDPCPGLLFSDDFAFDLLAGKITKFDRIHAISFGQIIDTTGMLGEFYPYRYDGNIANAIKLLKNGLLEELIVEGPFKSNFSKG